VTVFFVLLPHSNMIQFKADRFADTFIFHRCFLRNSESVVSP
jgi:hypothetical protein